MSQSQLLFAVLEYLSQIRPTYDEDTQQSLDVGLECLATLENLDVNDEEQQKTLGTGFSLPALVAAGLKECKAQSKFDAFVNLLKQRNFFAGLTEGSPDYETRLAQAKTRYDERFGKTKATEVKQAPKREATEDEKKQATSLKNEGNARLGERKLEEAIELYTQAIALHPTAIYHTNRAYAKMSLNQYTEALPDCEAATKLDPNYAKGHLRLAQVQMQLAIIEARQSVEKARAAMQVYQACRAADPRVSKDITGRLAKMDKSCNDMDRAVNGTLTGAAATTTVATPPVTQSAPAADAKAANPLEALGGLGGLDFNALANNPMVQNLAEQFMGASGGGGAGGGMDLGSLMNNPMMQQMMGSMMGAMGGGATNPTPTATSTATTTTTDQPSATVEGSEAPAEDVAETASTSESTTETVAETIEEDTDLKAMDTAADSEQGQDTTPSTDALNPFAAMMNDPNFAAQMNNVNPEELMSQLGPLMGMLGNMGNMGAPPQ